MANGITFFGVKEKTNRFPIQFLFLNKWLIPKTTGVRFSKTKSIIEFWEKS